MTTPRPSSRSKIPIPLSADAPLRIARAAHAASVGDFARVPRLSDAGAATLPEALARATKHAPYAGITMIEADDRETFRSYVEIEQSARAIAESLVARGVAPGDRVLLLIPTGFDFVTTFLGTLMAGATAVPLYPPALMNRLDTYVERLAAVRTAAGAKVVVAPRQLLPILGELALGKGGVQRMLATEELLPGESEHVDLPKIEPQTRAFIQYTSGSTGHPKGVVLTHASIVANVRAINQAVRMSTSDTCASWLPLYHDMGLVGGLLSPLYAGIHAVVMSPLAFLADPAIWLRAITKHKATLSPAPNFGYARCVKRVRGDDLRKIDLSSWRAALSGAEPVNVRTLFDFASSFARAGFKPSTFLPVYGLAEATLAVTFPRLGDPILVDTLDRAALAEGKAIATPNEDGFHVVGVGRPLPGHRVRIVDADGKLLYARQIGQVEARGPSIMSGYFGDEEATESAFRGPWLRTGDLGYVADGNLFITGRSKDLVKIRGRAHYAEDLELAAERVREVRAGGSVAFAVYDEEAATDRVVILCETRTALASDADKVRLLEGVRETVGEITGVVPDEVVLLPPGTVPKTSSGKRQRARARELYQRGELKLRRTGRRAIAWAMMKSGVGLLLARARGLVAPRIKRTGKGERETR